MPGSQVSQGVKCGETREVLEEITTPAQLTYLKTVPGGSEFLAGLPGKINDLSARLGLSKHQRAGDGATSVAVRCARGEQECVLKVDPDPGRSASASAVLRAWERAGVAPKVYESGDGWYLMEYVHGETVPTPMSDLQAQGGPGLDALVTAWGTRVNEEAYVDRFGWVLPLTEERLKRLGHPRVSSDLVKRAGEVLKDLRAGEQMGTCHGDPVGGNILIREGRGFLIDPVPHADPLTAVLTHWAVRAREGEDALKLTRWGSARVGVRLEEDRVKAWMSLHALTLAGYYLTTGKELGVVESLLDPLR